MNGIVFLISFLVSLTFVLRKATGCVIILCLATWLSGFISCRSFLMKSLGSFMYGISPTNKDALISSFPIYFPFTFLYLSACSG